MLNKNLSFNTYIHTFFFLFDFFFFSTTLMSLLYLTSKFTVAILYMTMAITKRVVKRKELIVNGVKARVENKIIKE